MKLTGQNEAGMVGPHGAIHELEGKEFAVGRVRLASERQAFYNPLHPVTLGLCDYDLRIEDELSRKGVDALYSSESFKIRARTD